MRLLSLLLLLSVALFAQQSGGPVSAVNVAPSGLCSSNAAQLVGPGGTVSTCQAGTWANLAASVPAILRVRAIGVTFDGGGSALTAGATKYLTVPFACTISAWNMAVDTGTATVDVWKIASGTAVPTISNTITASALPAISTGTALHSTALTGWTTSAAANDIWGINLKTVATATQVNLIVECDQ